MFPKNDDYKLFCWAITVIAIVSLALTFAPHAHPAPDRPAPSTDYTGTCPFGDISQVGKIINIKGTPWEATGTLRRDGLVELYWRHEGRLAVGLYRVDDEKTFAGSWGWFDECNLEDGDLCGEILPEVFHVNIKK